MFIYLIISINLIISFNDFRKGTSQGGLGADIYVSPSGKLKLIGQDWDFNDDGYLDVVVSIEKGEASYVFYGSPYGFGRKIDTLEVQEREACSIADFNDDGFEDILLVNSLNGYCYIFYGSKNGFFKKDSFESPANHGSASIADLNNDGYLDIVWSSWYYQNMNSLIYWGSSNGYSILDTTQIPIKVTHGNIVADFNKDGFLDILIGRYFGYKDGDKTTFTYSYLFYGSENGFDWDTKDSFLTVGVGDDISIADLDNNGWLDIVFPNHSALPPPKWSGYPYSYIYYNKNGKFKRDSLLTLASWSSSIADIDNNGLLDIVFSNCPFGDTLPKNYSYIYYQMSAGKFERDSLPTRGGSAVMIADFNNDGFKDIIFGNESYKNIYVYYNSINGFTRKEVISCGQVDASITKDLGNLYNRTDTFIYYSPIMKLPFSDTFSSSLLKISWEADTVWHNDFFPPHIVVGVNVFIRGGELKNPDTFWTEWYPVYPTELIEFIPPFEFLQFKIEFITNHFASITLNYVECEVIYNKNSVFSSSIYFKSPTELKIFDSSGRCVYREKRARDIKLTDIKLPKGVYFLYAGNSVKRKMVVIIPF